MFVFLWSTGFISAKYGLPHAEPMTLLFVRMALVVAIFAVIAAVARPAWPDATGIAHSAVAGALVHALYLGGVFIAIASGVPAGLSALIPGVQPVLMSTIASRFLGERVAPRQWLGLALGLGGVVLVLHDRTMAGGDAGGWLATFVSLLGITLGTLYQKRWCAGIDWRAGNLVQYAAAGLLFGVAALAFERREIAWNVPFALSLAWMVLGMSFGAVGLLYWLLRRAPATRLGSLFYLVPAVTAVLAFVLFGERLDALSLAGMAVCAAGVYLVNLGRPAG